jgi:hypothetical protein
MRVDHMKEAQWLYELKTTRQLFKVMVRCNLTRALTCSDFNLEAVLSAESEEELEEVIQGLEKTGERCDHSITGHAIRYLGLTCFSCNCSTKGN